jgi:hypothetical protein
MVSYPLTLAAAIAVGAGFAVPHPHGALNAAEASTAAVSHALVTVAPPLIARGSDEHDRAGSDPDPTVSTSVAARAEAALAVLAGRVPRQSHPHAVRRAFEAYFAYKAAHPAKVRKPYLYFVDYGLDNRSPRGYVFDMVALKLVEGPFTVAHGRGSATGPDGVPTRFSNTKDSNASSLGLYLAQETYAFSGKSGGRRYHSVGLRLQGLSGRFNSAARARGVVAHGAPYVTAAQAGRSEGCPALEEDRARRLLPRIANGGLVYLFSPHDEGWLREDPWSRSGAGRLAAASR